MPRLALYHDFALEESEADSGAIFLLYMERWDPSTWFSGEIFPKLQPNKLVLFYFMKPFASVAGKHDDISRQGSPATKTRQSTHSRCASGCLSFVCSHGQTWLALFVCSASHLLSAGLPLRQRQMHPTFVGLRRRQRLRGRLR